MRLSLALVIAGLLLGSSLFAQNEEITKKGINFGPLPAIAFDADKGFQAGAILNVYNYGDGTVYPNYNSKLYLEASFFTKGSLLFTASYDNKNLIPGVRWSSSISTSIDKAYDFYGFNGYQSWFNQERFLLGNNNKKQGQNPENYLYSPYYRVSRSLLIAKSDFIGRITDNLSWEAGYHLIYVKENPINRKAINKGKPEYNLYPDSETTLYENYLNWGIISGEQADGGLTSSVRLGLVYDTRDKEGAPTRGVWAEGHVILAPEFLGTETGYARYALTLRQYFPLIKNDVLTLAYRLNYQGCFGSAPFYALPFISVMGENFDKDGMGGYRTARGIMRSRVLGLDMATYTAELRWRFVKFNWLKQNMSFGLSAFSDGTMVTRGLDMSFKGDESFKNSYLKYMAEGRTKDVPHITVGAGLRFIMNQNFIVAFEYGAPVSHFYPKSHPLYNQDGTGAFYINTGYLF